MAKKTSSLTPTLEKYLKTIGENLRLARLRRHLSAEMIAERAGMTRPTLRSIERGDPSVTMGAYAKVLFTLGLEKDILYLGQNDILGRKLQDADLSPSLQRSPRIKKIKNSGK